MMDREVSITVTDSTLYKQNFTSLRSFYEFCKAEEDFWKDVTEQVEDPASKKHRFVAVTTTFKNIQSQIDKWRDNLSEWDDAQFRSSVNTLNQQFLLQLQNTWLWSGHPYTKPFIDCLICEGQEAATAFIDFVGTKTITNPNQYQSFKGILLGYEFTSQDSKISGRYKGEEVSFDHLRAQLVSAKDDLFSEIANEQKTHEDWTEEARQKTQRLYDLNKRLGERRIRQHNHQFDENLRAWSNTIQELEQTYEEKLRLDKPAEYWKKSARKYGMQGVLWMLAVVALVAVAAINFQELFVNWLQGKDIGIELSSLQGIILFGSIAAIYAFLLKILARLVFSSFHLMRDAEEREQLTYLYLSLANESAIDENSRDIVLQALFSRSETGLLAQEHGPKISAGEAIAAAMRSRGAH